MTPEELRQANAGIESTIITEKRERAALEAEAQNPGRINVELPLANAMRTANGEAKDRGLGFFKNLFKRSPTEEVVSVAEEEQIFIQNVDSLLTQDQAVKFDIAKTKFRSRQKFLEDTGQVMDGDEINAWVAEFDKLPVPEGMNPRDMIEAREMYIHADRLKGKIKAEEAKLMIEGTERLLLFRQGWSREEVDQEFGGIESNPIIDPTSFIPGLAIPLIQRGLGTGVFKAAAKLAPKEARALLRFELGQSVAADVIATGAIWTADELLDMGPVGQVMTGLFGGAAGGMLFTMSYMGLRTWIHALRAQNPNMARQMSRELADMNDAFSQTAKQFLQEPSFENTRALSELAARAENAGLQVEMPTDLRSLYAAAVENDKIAHATMTKIISGTGMGTEEISNLRHTLGVDAWAETIGGMIDPTPVDPRLLDIQKNLRAGKGIVKNMIRRPRTQLGRGANNAAITQQLAGQEIMYNVEGAKQQAVLNTVKTRLFPSRQYIHGQDNVVLKGGVKTGAPRFILSPSNFFKDVADVLVTQSSLNALEARRMKAAVAASTKEIFRDLSKTGKQELMKMIHESDDLEEVYKVTARGLENSLGNVITRNPSLIDSYFAYRMLDDSLGIILNGAQAGSFRARGFKWLGNQVVKPSKLANGQLDSFGTKWTTKLGKAGGMVIEHGNGKKRVLNPSQALKVTEIPDGAQVFKRRVGHMARVYQDPWVIVKVGVDDAGQKTANRIETGPTYKQVNARIKGLEQTADDTVHYVAIKKNAVLDSLDVSKTQRSTDFFRNLSDEDQAQFRKALLDLGLPADDVSNVEASIYLRKVRESPFAKVRKEKKLKALGGVEDAPLVPADEALSRYANSVIDFSSTALYTAKLNKAFQQTYRDVIDPKTGEVLPIRSVSGDGLHMRAEALAVRHQIDHISKIPTELELADARMWEGFAHRIYNTGWYNKFVGPAIDKQVSKLLDNFSLTKGGRALRGITAVNKLGLWSTAQFVVQSTSILNVGAHMFKYGGITDIAGGSDDFMAAMMAAGPLKWAGKNPSNKATELWEEIRNSGFIADLDFQDLQAMYGGGLAKNTVFRKVIRTGLIPFKAGEAIQRGIIWMTERRRLIRAIEDGTSKFTKFEIGSQQFLDQVSENAYRFSLNMSGLDQPRFARGLLSIPLQFKQFMVKQSELMSPLNAKTTKAEKFGMATAWGAAFGMGGIPYMMDALNLTDYAIAWSQNDPTLIGSTKQAFLDAFVGTSMEFLEKTGVVDPTNEKDVAETKAWLERLQLKGLTNATDSDTDIATRAALGMVFNQFWYNTDVVDLAFGASSGLVKQFFSELGSLASAATGGTRDGDLLNLYKILTQEDSPDVMGSLISLTNEMSGPKNILRAVDALTDGELRGPNRQPMVANPTLKEITLTAIGITPARAVRAREQANVNVVISKIFREWSAEKVETIARLYVDGNTVTANQLLDEYMKQLAEVNTRLMPVFYSKIQNKMFQKIFDKQTMTLIRGLNSVMVPLDRAVAPTIGED
jgi:hypothetical protein